jgi:hypothetical protein
MALCRISASRRCDLARWRGIELSVFAVADPKEMVPAIGGTKEAINPRATQMVLAPGGGNSGAGQQFRQARYCGQCTPLEEWRASSARA